jgi:predicted nucleotidyltransferase
MNREIEQRTKHFLEHLKKTKIFSKIEFVILFGSSLSSYHLTDSDIDLCLYIDEEKKKLSKIRLELLKMFDENLDIQIFQLLPLYIQIEVLKGKVLYIKEEDRLYEIAYKTIEEYEEFYQFYTEYINR